MISKCGAVSIVVLLGAVSVQADMLDATGMEAWETCALCHSADGVSAMPKFPKLAGQKAAYIESQLLHFRHGRRVNDGGQMQTVSRDVELKDVEEIAHYFSALPLPEFTGDLGGSENLMKVARGRIIFYQGGKDIPACAKCHADKNSVAPWLDGQHSLYIEKQLKDFRESRRTDFAVGEMANIAKQLTDSDIESLAMFLEKERLSRDSN